ncbi:MAG: DeoR/GlpR family DNA-binding transcription regulator [Sphaerochaetaceae bacterium]
MLAVERLSAIEKALNTNDCVSVADLSRSFSVTEETIRRDLEKIVTNDPTVVRVHGGAYKIKTFDHEAPYQLREQMLVEEKERIAKASFSRLVEGDTIMLDSSTTALHLAQCIKQNTLKLSVITNSLRIASELSDCDHTNLIVTGGAFRQSSRSFVGYATTNMLKDLHADKAFVSCSGVHEKFGLTDNNESEAQVRRLMLANSDHRFLLVDSDKFGRCKNFHITDVSGVHAFLTNKEPDRNLKELLAHNQVELIIC